MATGPISEAPIAWAGRSWRLRVVEQQTPDGATVAKGIIEHPGAVVLIPLLEDGRILMLRQYRLSLDQTILELPAGTRGWDEAWLACAQRELREETGYRAAHFTPLGRVWAAPGYSNEVMALYLASGLTPAPLQADFDEEIVVQPMPLAELVDMARGGEIQDAKTIAALLRAAAHLGA